MKLTKRNGEYWHYGRQKICFACELARNMAGHGDYTECWEEESRLSEAEIDDVVERALTPSGVSDTLEYTQSKREDDEHDGTV